MYLFDTDHCSYLMKGRFQLLGERFRKVPFEDRCVSAVTLAETLTGLEEFPLTHPGRGAAIRFYRTVRVLDWPKEAAAYYAEFQFRVRKQPIGDRDVMIAAHAVALDATLVTNNLDHYSRIGIPLRIESWVR